MKVRRSAPCPCESGKLYKNCCANIKKEERIFHDHLVNFILNNDSVELLCFVAYLQLVPENSSKIVRLENIQHKIIGNLHSKHKGKKIDYRLLKSILDQDYNYDLSEDPSESCFSENIMFMNGNNIVFPGICNNCTETNQLILNSLFQNHNEIDEECKNQIKDGVFTNLYIHNKIATEIGIKRYDFIDDYRGKLLFPNNITSIDFTSLFKFSKDEISSIINKFKLSYDIFQDLSIDYKNVKKTSIDESNLIKRPFIVYEDIYYLTLPSSQMFSLNIFLNNKIAEYNNDKELQKTFHQVSRYEGDLIFKRMGWELVKDYKEDVDFDIDIWKFDTNKYAIVYYDFQTTQTKLIYDKIDNLVKNSKVDNNFILLTITSIYRLELPSTIIQPTLENLDYQMIVGLLDLKRLHNLWNLKKLDIWKYLRAKNRAEEKGIYINQFFSILTFYSYYKKNENSFLHSDDAKPDFLNFTFDIQGNRVIESLQKEDRHLVKYLKDRRTYGYLPVSRYDSISHVPLYIADTIFNGEMKIVLEKYNFPIWITSHKDYDIEAKNFIEAVAYWLNEIHPTLNCLLSSIPNIPVNIELSFEDSFYNYNTQDLSNHKNSNVDFDFTIDKNLNKIEIIIPSSIHVLLYRNDNYGEKRLVEFILICIFDLLNLNFNALLNKTSISGILDKHMPLSMAKMVIAGNTLDDIRLDNRYISARVERLDKADTSIILEDMIEWMNIDVPQNIQSKEEKINVCVIGIDSLINKIKEILSEYNSIDLIKLIIIRNETLLNDNAFKQLRTVTYYECFKNYKDAVNDFIEDDSKNIRTALSIRCLIEFIVAEPNYGSKKPSNSDIDFLVALIDELIFLGTTKDLLNFDLDNPEMGKLESGRLGINKEYFEKINVFSIKTKKDEHYEYVEKYNYINDTTTEQDVDSYYNKIGSTFEKEFGLNFFKIRALMHELAQFCFEKNNSYLIYNDIEFVNVLQSEFNLNTSEVESFKKHFILDSRGKISLPPDGYDYADIFPWRYNRTLSYLLRPIIRIKDKDEVYKIIISARHLVSSADNFFAVFFNGSLRISPEFKGINALLSQRNNIKGKEFRNEVYNWLKYNTDLEIIPYEFKIPVKGNIKNYGDVDILAFDKKNKIIYSIECKNTKQAKIIYEFQRDAKNYINKQLPKHLDRSKWLTNNLDYLSERFEYNFCDFKIKSFLISSYQLPLKLVQDIDEITIVSLTEIKRNKYF